MIAVSVNTFLVCMVLLIFGNLSFAKTVWNPTTGPLPPAQPQEVGFQTDSIVEFINGTTNVAAIASRLSSYTFLSYNQLKGVQSTSGLSYSLPKMQTQYSNYNLTGYPSQSAGLLISYNNQNCQTVQVTVNDYMGYTFYTDLMVWEYNQGVTIYFEYINLPEIGLCLKYSLFSSGTSHTYIFQNSTGYIIQHDMSTLEYCCQIQQYSLCDPYLTTCPVGSHPPQLQYAINNQTFSDYAVFDASYWPDNFFVGECPFSSNTPTVSPTASPASSGKVLNTPEILSITFAGLFIIAAVLAIFFYFKLSKLVTAGDNPPLVKSLV